MLSRGPETSGNAHSGAWQLRANSFSFNKKNGLCWFLNVGGHLLDASEYDGTKWSHHVHQPKSCRHGVQKLRK